MFAIRSLIITADLARGGNQRQTRSVATVRHGYEAGSQSMRQVNLGF